ncbi:hypothetical protein N801_11520 [Knoellia aerolata DSM 18566]|uniref:Uncharacterized protein n=1 Tax=Knoellia aerolata DSM 18566 TaxID=1385519 RepID=A0A0A0JZI4_9MICO|nr:hypothetical protein N801_11520 [Knoellia aerolata DSM 18566]
MEPEPQPVAQVLVRDVVARPAHLVDGLAPDDPAVEQGQPEPVHVVGGRERPAVPVAEHREVERVDEVALVPQVAERRVGRELVEREEARVPQARRLEHQALHDVVVGPAGGALECERQHHVAAVAVGEALARGEHLWVALEHGQERLRRGEGVGRHVEDEVRRLPRALVEVVPDPRRLAQQVLDRHAVVDEGQVRAEQSAQGLVEAQLAVLDEPHHRQRGERLAATGDADPRAGRHGCPQGPVGEALAPLEGPVVVDVHRHHAGEGRLPDRLVEQCRVHVQLGPWGHLRLLLGSSAPHTAVG